MLEAVFLFIKKEWNVMKIEIVEHSGKTHVTTDENYDPKATYESIKAARTSDDNTVLIGNVVIDARNISSISVVEEN